MENIQMVNMIVGLFLIVLGGLMAVCNRAMVRFQIWSQRTLMGAQYIPSKRTYAMMRAVGIVLALLGLIIAAGILK